jgi:hypothetical protein
MTKKIKEKLIVPPLMKIRHEILNKVHSYMIQNKDWKNMFNYKHAKHADLELSWMGPKMQKKLVGENLNESEILIAKLMPKQKSKAHLHEIGSSSFIVLGKKLSLPDPKTIKFTTYQYDYSTRMLCGRKVHRCKEGDELDIPSHLVHQFENTADSEAYLLIVAKPIISTTKDFSDIHFV